MYSFVYFLISAPYHDQLLQCLFEGAHGIHFTKKARFLSTSKRFILFAIVRDRYLLFARILLPLVIVNVFLLESYRMTRKYFVFVFSNFSSEQWLVFYGIFRLHVTCTIKTQENYELQILHCIATFCPSD